MTDLISDMLTRIRNASSCHHYTAIIPYSAVNQSILKIFHDEHYITRFEKIQKKEKTYIKIHLKYKGWWIKKPSFITIQKISKPGKRVFLSYTDFRTKINLLKYNQGLVVISTSSGIMSHEKAIKLQKGGEILCYIG